MSRRIRSLLQETYWKLLPVLLAALLWFKFVGDPNTLASLSVPVHYRNLPAELEITSELPETVHIELRGADAKLTSLADTPPALTLDFARESLLGERTFTIDEANVHLPAGVTLVRAVPSQIRLRFERRSEKTVPVQVRFAGPPRPGYRVTSTMVDPARVTIAGPESTINRLDNVETDAIDLSNVLSTSEFRVNCGTSDPRVTIRRGQRVAVKVTVEKIPADK